MPHRTTVRARLARATATLAAASGLVLALPAPPAAAHHSDTANPYGRDGGDGLATSTRWSGPDRYATAAALAGEDAPAASTDPATSAVVTTGEQFADALSASYLAGAVDGPVLLTPGDALAPVVAARLGGDEDADLRDVETVYVVGGAAAVAPGVEAALKELGVTVRRIAGADRVGTAVAVATSAPGASVGTVGGQRTAVLARSDAFPDALVAGVTAAAASVPLLLTAPDALDPRTAAALHQLDVDRVVLAGGEAALSSTVELALRADGFATTRLAGRDRAGTAAAFADFHADELGFGPDRVALARGDDHADAVALAPYAGRARVSILLTASATALGATTSARLGALGTCAFDTLLVAGGTSAVSTAVERAARTALTPAGDCTLEDERVEDAPRTFSLLEATVSDVQEALAGRQLAPDGSRLTCVTLAEQYVERIARLDATPDTGLPINSVLQLNPSWREQAAALDAAYARTGPVGELHCAPVLLKDLYDTYDHPTTAGSAALAGSQPPDDAFSVAGLRSAGALILGKAAMTEFAYWTQSFNSRNGRIATPYDTSRDAGGSSGGSAAALASNFALLGTGSDTCASIRLPPSNSGLVGIRSSVGLVSQDGLVPLSHTQDVGGPITRTVADAARTLDAMAGVDAADVRTQDPERVQERYTAFLNADGLRGKRIGVLRSYGGTATGGHDADVDAVLDQAVADMAAQGAEIVETVELPEFSTVSVIVQEFADHLDEYLASFDAPRADTVDVFTSGQVHPFVEALVGASLAARDTSSEDYRAALATRERMRAYVEAEMDRLHLDALVYPPVHAPAQPTGQVQGSNCDFSATTSMPSIVVPAGGTAATPSLPIGVEVFGRKWDEARLVEIAYAYERATSRRFGPPLPGDEVAAP